MRNRIRIICKDRVKRLIIYDKSGNTFYLFTSLVDVEAITVPWTVRLSDQLSLKELIYFFFTEFSVFLGHGDSSRFAWFSHISIFIGQLYTMLLMMPESIGFF